MTEETTSTRRRLLRAGVVAATIPIAGCAVEVGEYEVSVGDGEQDDAGTPTDEMPTPTPTATLTSSPSSTPNSTPTPMSTSTPPPTATPQSSIPNVQPQTPVGLDFSPHLDESLEAPDGDGRDIFGSSVALSNDSSTAVIGAPGDEDTGAGTGSVYVFGASDGDWRHRTKLTASDGSETEGFGQSVAVSGDGTAVIVGGQQGNDYPVAHVFELRNGTYIQQKQFEGHEEFLDEPPVAVSGDGRTALLGNSGFGSEPRPVYVLDAPDGTWDYGVWLEPQRYREWSIYGQSVALSDDGTTAIVGGPPAANREDSYVGTAHAFVRSDDLWRHTRLRPDDAEEGDLFGEAVAVSEDGTTAIVGAPGDQHPNSPAAGAAYVFERSGGRWRQADKFRTFDDEAANLEFAMSVSVSDDGSIAVIGAPHRNSFIEDRIGVAYVFEESDDGWSTAAKLPPEGAEHEHFATSVAVGGDGATAIIGERGFSTGSDGDATGRAYVFAEFI